jgi:hypothetical protein
MPYDLGIEHLEGSDDSSSSNASETRRTLSTFSRDARARTRRRCLGFGTPAGGVGIRLDEVIVARHAVKATRPSAPMRSGELFGGLERYAAGGWRAQASPRLP